MSSENKFAIEEDDDFFEEFKEESILKTIFKI